MIRSELRQHYVEFFEDAIDLTIADGSATIMLTEDLVLEMYTYEVSGDWYIGWRTPIRPDSDQGGSTP